MKTNSIITKRGDQGYTDCLYGRRVEKSDAVLEVIGAIDELNAWVGYAANEFPGFGGVEKYHLKVQGNLVAIMGEISAGIAMYGKYARDFGKTITEADIAELESIVHKLEEGRTFRDWATPESRWDIACRVCRRAEREMRKYCHEMMVLNLKCGVNYSDITNPIRTDVLVYINRLSDLLWIWGRK